LSNLYTINGKYCKKNSEKSGKISTKSGKIGTFTLSASDERYGKALLCVISI